MKLWYKGVDANEEEDAGVFGVPSKPPALAVLTFTEAEPPVMRLRLMPFAAADLMTGRRFDGGMLLRQI